MGAGASLAPVLSMICGNDRDAARRAESLPKGLETEDIKSDMLSLLVKCTVVAFAGGLLTSNGFAFSIDPVDLIWAFVVIGTAFALREMTFSVQPTETA